MRFRRPDRGRLAILALTGAAALSACGGTQQTKTVTVRTPAPDAATVADESKPSTSSGSSSGSARHVKTTLIACDANVSVKAATTTCPFAENVFYEFWRGQERGGATHIEVFSPALAKFLAVDCKDGDRVECRTDAGALVRFPQRAVHAYTAANAAKYARGHTVSKAPRSPIEAPNAPSAPESDCDPNYEGACLDPSASDYDCEGGSGDGPEYTAAVTVVGDDHFDLDRDGNGSGCE